MNEHTPDRVIPGDRVPDILARTAEIDRERNGTSRVEALRAIAVDAGISLSWLETALQKDAVGAQRPLTPESAQGMDPTGGPLLSVFFGGFSVHPFYLNDNKIGPIYLIFFWTLIPSLPGLLEGFRL